MAVQVIHDPVHDVGALFCTTDDWAFGPVFKGPDSDEQAEAFLDWFSDGSAAELASQIGVHQLAGRSGADPRHWDDRALEQLFNRWRALRAEAAAEEEVPL